MTVGITRDSSDTIEAGDCFDIAFPVGGSGEPYEDSKEEFQDADPDFEFYQPFPADFAYTVEPPDIISATVERISETKLRVRITDTSVEYSTATFYVNSFTTPYS